MHISVWMQHLISLFAETVLFVYIFVRCLDSDIQAYICSDIKQRCDVIRGTVCLLAVSVVLIKFAVALVVN